MSKFKVGDRVRKVANRLPCDSGINSAHKPIGMGAIVYAFDPEDGQYEVIFDDGDVLWVMPYQIGPIDDDKDQPCAFDASLFLPIAIGAK